MPGLRFAYLLALSVWLGGLVALGTVTAPLTFEILQARVPDEGRMIAGSLFGAMLATFSTYAGVAGVLMIAALLGMALLGPRPRPYIWRLVVIVLMLLATLTVAGPLAWGIERVQREAGRPMDTLAPGDSRRQQFARLHGWSNALLLANVTGGLLLLWWEARH